MPSTVGLSSSVRTRLSIMMFLQYAFNGIWIMPLNTYLTSPQVGFTGAQAGAVFGMLAIGCIIAPFFVGMIADRYFAGQKVLGVLNIFASVILYVMSSSAVGPNGQPQVALFQWLMLAHCACYMPTWALTNHIALTQMDNPGKQFPGIRVMGTIGWIAVGTITLFSDKITRMFGMSGNIEATRIPMQLGAAIGLITAGFSFFLPDTPPAGREKKVSLGEILGTKALGLFKDKNFAIFAFSSFLILLPGMFYWGFCNLFLNEVKMAAPMFKQTYGQMAETVFLAIMPFFFVRLGVKWMMLIGMVSWIARFTCFSYGQIGTSTGWLITMGLILHGACYDFFFVTGQLYTDHKAPREIRASAQGLISLITFGLGWFVGSNLAGNILDKYAIQDVAGKVINHNWHVIWLYPLAMAVVIMVFFFFAFSDNVRVGHEASAADAEKSAEREVAQV